MCHVAMWRALSTSSGSRSKTAGRVRPVKMDTLLFNFVPISHQLSAESFRTRSGTTPVIHLRKENANNSEDKTTLSSTQSEISRLTSWRGSRYTTNCAMIMTVTHTNQTRFQQPDAELATNARSPQKPPAHPQLPPRGDGARCRRARGKEEGWGDEEKEGWREHEKKRSKERGQGRRRQKKEQLRRG